MTPTSDAQPIILDGSRLSLEELDRIARESASIVVSLATWDAVDRAHDGLIDARANGSVYGANTGVGANRGVSVADGGRSEESSHSRRLLRSHCAGAGPVETDALARAAMVVRLNQILAGGSGVSGTLAKGLGDAIISGAVPTLHGWGAIGTADLSPMAELALTLAGERSWASGGIGPIPLAETDALPFMSSSAVTLATSALGVIDMETLLAGAEVVASLSFLALNGSGEAYADEVQRSRAHPHQIQVAARMRSLIGPARADAARIQDPFALRVVPQVHAPALASLERLRGVVLTEINAAAENPLVTSSGVFHHGQFHLATLAAALDHVRVSTYPVFTLSSTRLGALLRPELTGLRPFLADDIPGSSGLMITEYLVQDVLATLRMNAAPTSGAALSISLGLEEHASFATQGARALHEMASLSQTVIAVEAVAAVRALRLAPERLRAGRAADAFDYLAAELSDDLDDRPLGDDIERAKRLLPGLVNFVGDAVLGDAVPGDRL